MLRTASCLGVAVDLIEPLGFVFSDKQLRRAGMDYLDDAEITRHLSWAAFNDSSERLSARLVLLSTRAELPYTDFAYGPTDILMVGRESAGVPDDVYAACDAHVRVPMQAGARSLNVAVSAAMVLGEALRQTG